MCERQVLGGRPISRARADRLISASRSPSAALSRRFFLLERLRLGDLDRAICISCSSSASLLPPRLMTGDRVEEALAARARRCAGLADRGGGVARRAAQAGERLRLPQRNGRAARAPIAGADGRDQVAGKDAQLRLPVGDSIRELSAAPFRLSHSNRKFRRSSRRRDRSGSSIARPVPSATHDRGSSATLTGRPVSSSQIVVEAAGSARRRRSARCPGRRCRRPVQARCSRARCARLRRSPRSARTALRRCWPWLMVISLGTPFTRSRPLMWIVSPTPSAGHHGDAVVLLDALGGAFADQQVVVAADIADDRLVHLVAADAHRSGIGQPAQREDRDFGRAAADIDDHRTDWLGHRHVGADSGRHRLQDQEDLARTGIGGGVADRARSTEVAPEGTQMTIFG